MEFNFAAALVWSIMAIALLGAEIMLFMWREGAFGEPNRRLVKVVGYYQDRINVIICIVIVIWLIHDDLTLMQR